jgi:hypothetical protein
MNLCRQQLHRQRNRQSTILFIIECLSFNNEKRIGEFERKKEKTSLKQVAVCKKC